MNREERRNEKREEREEERDGRSRYTKISRDGPRKKYIPNRLPFCDLLHSSDEEGFDVGSTTIVHVVWTKRGATERVAP